jgi:dihydroorotate dehydrogenase electron transfer subunit
LSRPLSPFGRRTCRVTANDAVGAYRVLRADDADGPEPAPGQFYMLSAAERWGAGEDERPYLPRAFSYLRRVDGELHFMLEDVGPGTARLCELRAGEELWVLGPLGEPFRAPSRRPVLCGGGVGIAPLAALQDSLGAAATVLLGFRDAEHAPGAALMRDAEIATDDGSAGHHGRVTELLERELDDDVEVFACGPPPMLEAVRALCAERGVPAQLALEAGMACGYGACFGCVVPTRDGYARVCVDGPVFEAAALESALVPGVGH